jgi:hypothetical protein
MLVERQEDAEHYNALLSPNARWVVFVIDEELRGSGLPPQIVITEFPEGKSRYPVSEGSMPIWSPDGGRIYFVHQRRMMEVEIQEEPTLRVSAPRELFSLEGLDYSQYWYPDPGLDISPGGEHFVMTRPVEDWDLPNYLCITTNFFEVIKEKVPTE